MNFWISWFHTPELGAYELHSPWWVSGVRIVADRFNFDEEVEHPTICAAVRADSEEAVKEAVLASYDKRPTDLEWRFCEPRDDTWTPFNGRFPKAGWMQWPAQ